MNRTLKILMLADGFVVTGFGLVEPILAIYIKENLIGGTIFAAGAASTLFIVIKSVLQIPLAKYVDKHDHKVMVLIIGMFMIAGVPFIYIFATTIKMMFLAQAIYGIGAALAYPTWLGLWSTHLDKHKESFQWSVYSTSAGLGAAFSASVGAAIAQFVGFQTTFAIVGAISLIGCFILLGLEKKIDRKTGGITSYQYHISRKDTDKKKI
jgi:MFS family permease